MKTFLKLSVASLFVMATYFQSVAQEDSLAQTKLIKDLTPDLNLKLDALKQELNSGQIKNPEDLTTKMYDIIYGVEAKMYPAEPDATQDEEISEKEEGSGEMKETEAGAMNMKPKRKSGWKSGINFNIGFATALEGSGVPDDSPDINFWRSAMLEYGFNFRKSLNSANTIGLNIGLTYLYFDFDTKEQQLAYDGTKDKVKFIKDSNLKDSDFGAGYINIPVALDFKIGRKLNLAIGGFGAIRTNSFSSSELKTDLDERIDINSNAKYNMNPFIYGGRINIGTKTAGLYIHYTANSIFKDQYELNPFSVGLRIGM